MENMNSGRDLLFISFLVVAAAAAAAAGSDCALSGLLLPKIKKSDFFNK